MTNGESPQFQLQEPPLEWVQLDDRAHALLDRSFLALRDSRAYGQALDQQGRSPDIFELGGGSLDFAVDGQPYNVELTRENAHNIFTFSKHVHFSSSDANIESMLLIPDSVHPMIEYRKDFGSDRLTGVHRNTRTAMAAAEVFVDGFNAVVQKAKLPNRYPPEVVVVTRKAIDRHVQLRQEYLSERGGWEIEGRRILAVKKVLMKEVYDDYGFPREDTETTRLIAQAIASSFWKISKQGFQEWMRQARETMEWELLDDPRDCLLLEAGEVLSQANSQS